MGFTKLFSDILCSSVWNEDDKTRIVWITLLALRGPNNVARGSIDGLAHQARVSIEDCEKAVAKLSSPDQYSGDPEFEGRRIEKVPHGWLILNAEKYKMRRDEEDRKEYMALYMRQYRRKQSVNNRKQALASLAQSEKNQSREEEEKSSSNGSGEPVQAALQIGLAPTKTPEKKKRRRAPMMNEEALDEFVSDPAYQGVDVNQEAWKFKKWCKVNNKLESVRRFTNWLNRIV
jgi:hypothetical protein